MTVISGGVVYGMSVLAKVGHILHILIGVSGGNKSYWLFTPTWRSDFIINLEIINLEPRSYLTI